MPLLQYTFRHPEGHELTETDLFPPSSDDEEMVRKECLDKIKAELITLEVKNPFIHPHTWKFTHKSMGRMFYLCERCSIGASRSIHNFKGPIGPYVRDEAHKSVKYELCHDPLKPMPPSTSLFR